VSAAWVAGSVRAVSLTRRRVGAAGARSLAANVGTGAALEALSLTPYGHDVRAGQSLAEAERAVGATLLWHLRVLAGWQPRAGADVVRLLAAGLEIANVTDRLRRFAGEETAAPYVLGTLETAWSRLGACSSAEDLGRVLATSAWGAPGTTSAGALLTWMRLSWADRVVGGVPEAASWARAATVLVLLRAGAAGESWHPQAVRRAAYVVGGEIVSAALGGRGPAALAPLLPTRIRWVLDGISGPEDLWLAEAAWWRRVEEDGFAMLRGAAFGRPTVVGAVAVLAVDAWRVRAALETAAWAGAREAGAPDERMTRMFDGVA
jgi:hypothetical protein